MTYNDCIERYKEELLKIIHEFYNENNISGLPILGISDRKSFFINTKKTLDYIEEVENMPLYSPNLAILKFLPKDKSGKPNKSELKKYILQKKSAKKRRLALLRGVCLEQHERWVKGCASFVQEMEKDVLPYLETSTTSPLFRFRFFDDPSYEDDLIDGDALSVFSCFTAYLQRLKLDGKKINQAIQIVKETMEHQGNDYYERPRDGSLIQIHSNVEKKELQVVVPFPERGINWDNVKWENIKMVIRVGSKEIDISINGSKRKNYNYSMMGFKQQRMDKPNKAWYVFLCLARADNNILSLKTLTEFSVRMKLQAFHDRMSEVRTKVKDLFPNLTGNPIPHTKKVGYKPKFSIFVIGDPTDSKEFAKETDNLDYQS